MALNALGLGFTVSAEDTASAVFNQVGGNLTKLEKKGKDVGASLEEVSGKIAGIGTALAGFGAAGLAGLGFASSSASDFGSRIAEVSTLVDGTTFSVDQMRESVFAMGQMFGGDLGDQVKAMYQGISAGASDAAGNTALLTQANKLSIAGVTDVRTAVDGLTNVLNAYGKAYTDQNLTGVSDAFFVALRGGKTTAAELASTLGKLAPVTNAVGISIDQMLAAVSAITTKGIATSETVAGLKAALAGVLKPTKEATDEAARLGITFSAAALRAQGLPAFLDSITHSANYNADTMSQLFGSVEGLNAILALTSNNSATFNGLLDQMGGKAGQTDAALAKMSDTTAHQLSLFESLRKETVVMIGEAFQPLFVGLVKGVNALMKAFTSAPAPLRKLIVTLFAVVSVGALVVGGVLLLVSGVMGLIAASGVLETALGAVAAIFLNLAIVMAPVLVLGGVLFALWSRNAGGFRDIVAGAIDKVVLAFKALGQLLSSGQLSGDVLKELNAGQQGVKNFAINVFLWFNRVRNYFVGAGEGFEQAMARAKPVLDAFGAALRRIGALFSSLQEGPQENAAAFLNWGAAGEKLGNIIGSVVEIIVKGMTMVASVVEGAITAWNFFWPVVKLTWSAVSGLFDAFGDIVAALVGVNTSTNATGGGFKLLGEIVGGVAAVFGILLNAAVTWVSMSLSVIAGFITSVRALVIFVIEMVSGMFNLVKALITGDWAGAWDAAKGMVVSWAKAVVGLIAGVVLAVAGAVDKLGKAFGKDFGLSDRVKGIQTEITDSLQKSMAKPAPGTGAQPSGAPGALPPAIATAAPGTGGPMVGTVAPPPTAANAPGVAAAQGQGDLAGAVKSLAASRAQPPPPLNATIPVKLEVDGQVLADTVARYSSDGRDLSPRGDQP